METLSLPPVLDGPTLERFRRARSRRARRAVLRPCVLLKAHIRESLGRIYVPRDVVMHDELPRNETGKVLKRELREQE